MTGCRARHNCACRLRELHASTLSRGPSHSTTAHSSRPSAHARNCHVSHCNPTAPITADMYHLACCCHLNPGQRQIPIAPGSYLDHALNAQSDLAPSLLPSHSACDIHPASSSYFVQPHVIYTAPSTYTFTLGVHTCINSNNVCCQSSEWAHQPRNNWISRRTNLVCVDDALSASTRLCCRPSGSHRQLLWVDPHVRLLPYAL